MGQALSLTLLLLLVLVGPAAAHPGRLDEHGCHHVHVRWVAKDGTVFEPGTEHCHRKLGEMKLDGRERLQDDDERQTEPPKEPRP